MPIDWTWYPWLSGIRRKMDEIGWGGATIDDAWTSTTSTRSSDKINSEINSIWDSKVYVSVWPSASYDYTTDGTNDEVELQAAIDAVNSVWGGTVYFDWTLTIDNDVNVKDYVTLSGFNWSSSKIKRANSNTIARILLTNNDYAVLKNFQYDGNKANNSIAFSWIVVPSSAPSPTNIKIENLWVHDCWESTSVDYAAGIDCFWTTNLHIVGCKTEWNAHYWINTYECTNVVVERNICNENWRHWIWWAGNTNITWSKNICIDNWDQGIWTRNNTRFSIIGNIVGYTSGSTSQIIGIQVKSEVSWGGNDIAEWGEVVGNVVYGVTCDTNNWLGIYLQGSASNNISIYANQVTWCDYNCYISNWSDLSVKHNTFSYSKYYDVYDSGSSNSHIDHNTCNDFKKNSIYSSWQRGSINFNDFHSEALDTNATYYAITYYNRTYTEIQGNTGDTLGGANALAGVIKLTGQYAWHITVFDNKAKTNITIVAKDANYGELWAGNNREYNNKWIAESSVVTVTATTYDIPYNKDTILCDTTSNAITVNLPEAWELAWRIINIKCIDATNPVTIDWNGSETIDWWLTYDITEENVSVTIQSDGSNWYIVSIYTV